MTFVPYPRHVHKRGGVFKVVQSDAERDAAVADGWALSPDQVGQPPPQPTPAAAPVVVDPPPDPAPAPPKKRRWMRTRKDRS